MPVLVGGLVLFGAGMALTVLANLGLTPWFVFHQGVASRIPFLSIGLITIVVSMVLLLAWIPLHQRPGIGTILNATVVGVVIDLILYLVDDAQVLWLQIFYLVGGIGLVAVGSGLYIGARLGPGPRDGIMTGLAERGMSIRRARTLIEGTVLIAGWLLGGSVGIGTVVFTVTIGPLIQPVLRRADKGPI